MNSEKVKKTYMIYINKYLLNNNSMVVINLGMYLDYHFLIYIY